MLDYLIQQLCKEMSIDPPLKPVSPGIYLLPLEGGVDVKIENLPFQGIMLSTKLGSVPPGNELNFLQDLLRANLFGEMTHGAVLGLSQDGGIITLSQTAEYRLNYTEFRDIVEDFLNTAEFWHDEALIK